LALSLAIENLLVERNLRGMASLQTALPAGYCYRAAKMMHRAATSNGTCLLVTGFPVGDPFETDGPVGAISLYRALEKAGATPILCCGDPLASALADDFRVQSLAVGSTLEQDLAEAECILSALQPSLLISIERPGLAEDGHYYNMRGEVISWRSACFDQIMNLCTSPTIAIGDGGNEIGMGNVKEALKTLNIVPAATTCDELIVADVSNWGGHALAALLGKLCQLDPLADFDNSAVLQYLSERGSVDGVTRDNTLTEDSLSREHGQNLILKLRQLCGHV
jgi:hypothetical protein